MKWYYLDTSALVKRYHVERGSDTVNAVFDDPHCGRSTSRLALTEMQSVIARRIRLNEIDQSIAEQVRVHLLEEIRCRKVNVLAVAPYEFRQAGRVLMSHGHQIPVRTLDAIHLACAIKLRQQNRADTILSSDKHLLSLAARDGFAVINPEQE